VLIDLSVPALDLASGDLRFRFGSASQHPPLHSLHVTSEHVDSHATVTVHILGGSHRIETEVASCHSNEHIIEEVACSTGPSAGDLPLPPAWTTGLYRFTSRVDTVAPSALSGFAQQLARCHAANPSAVVARFPGHDDAITAVSVSPSLPSASTGVLWWRTWHLYPSVADGGSEIVRTWTTVNLGLLRPPTVINNEAS
jgi:hypothetical protein